MKYGTNAVNEDLTKTPVINDVIKQPRNLIGRSLRKS